MRIFLDFRLSRNERGIAIILVFAALTSLFLISLPFVRSMHQARESARNYQNYLAAKQDAKSARHLAVSYLRQAHTLNQQANARNPNRAFIRQAMLAGMVPLNTPDVDSVHEFDVQRYLGELLLVQDGPQAAPRPIIDAMSARGRLWTVRVEDEQGKINVDTASPWLLGNIMGGTVLVDALDDRATTLSIDDGYWLDRRDGLVWIDGELIGYERCLPYGNGWRLVNCRRGLNGQMQAITAQTPGVPAATEIEFVRARPHEAGTPVVPAIAYKVFRFKIEPAVQAASAMALGQQGPNAPPALNWFRDIAALRYVADYVKYDGGFAETIRPELFAEIRDFLTLYSTDPFALNFTNPHILLGTSTNTAAGVAAIQVRGNAGFNASNILRIRSESGSSTEFVMAPAVAVNGNQARIDRVLQGNFAPNRAIVEVLQRHPINVNTAPLEVLQAVFQGLRIQTNDSVSPAEARRVARAVYDRIRDEYAPRPFIDAQDFADFIRTNYNEWGLSALDQQAIILNATANYDPRLLSPTAPFCYRSFDTYTIETVGMRTAEPLDGSPGIPLSQFALRETLTVAAPRLVGDWDQRDLSALLEARAGGIGAGLVLSSRGSAGGRMLPRVEMPIKPNPPTRRANNPNNPNNSAQIYDWPGLGQPIQQPPFRLDFSRMGQVNGTTMDLQAGYIGMWLRLADVDSPNLIWWDFSESDHSNRFCLFYDGSRHALVLRMADAGLETAWTDLVYPVRPQQGGIGPALRDGNWYHVLATWKGTPFTQLVAGEHIPARMNLMIDGMGCTPLNRTPGYTTYTVQLPNGIVQEQMTTLTQNLAARRRPYIDPNDPCWWEVHVADASWLPDAGLVEIGGEAILYTIKTPVGNGGAILTGPQAPMLDVDGNPTGNFSITGFIRGARGTQQGQFIAGTRVGPFGYSAFLGTHQQAPYLPGTRGDNAQTCGVHTGPNATPTGPLVIINIDVDPAHSDYQQQAQHGPNAGLPPANDPNNPDLTEPATEIRAIPGVFDDFPTRGFVLVRGNVIVDYSDPDPVTNARTANTVPNGCEIIYYNGKRSGTLGDPNNTPYDALVIQQRNALPVQNLLANAPPIPPIGFHFAGDGSARVALISWTVTDVSGYHDAGLVQIADTSEVILYTEKHPATNCLIYNNAQINSSTQWRAQLGSGLTPHTAGAGPVLPLFRVQGKGAYSHPAGAGDEITLVHGKNSDKRNTEPGSNRPLRIRWTRPDGQGQWATLSSHVDRDYHPQNGTRIMRFPSGELPVELPLEISIGGPTPGGGSGAVTNGMVDEVEYEGMGSGNFRLTNNVRAVDDDGNPVTRIYVNSIGQLHRDVGIVRIGDELIAYRQATFEDIPAPTQNNPNRTIRRYFLDGCIRGFLGTTPQNHGRNTLYLNIANARIGKLNGVLQANSGAVFNLAGENQGFPLDDVGYALAGTNPTNMEVIGYRRRQNRFDISEYMPYGQGLYRGRFGTDPQSHGNDAIIVGLPYRYIDRYADPTFLATNLQGRMTINSPEQFIVGGRFASPRTRWLRVHWQIENDQRLQQIEGNHIQIVLLVKPSTVASWEDSGVLRFVFNHRGQNAAGRETPRGPGASNSLQQVNDLGNLVADGLEWRVAFVFTNNAFRHDCWKWTPAFHGLYFDYSSGGATYSTREIPR